jgi:glyoxylase-like metal-dependent hydrolase (beta-lactamase superfamily II)
MNHLRVGDAELFRIEEMIDTSFVATDFIPSFDEAALAPHMDWLAPNHYNPATGGLSLSMHAWVVRTGRHTVLIDTCVGNDKDRMPRAHWHQMDTPFLDRLRATGVAPEDIDYVMCTHLHPDHVGWNTKLEDGRWVPTFPNAKYLFGEVEYEHWLANPSDSSVRQNAINDSVLPIVEAGRAEMIRDGHDVDGSFTVEASPGHTPGHHDFRLVSDGKDAQFTGDAIHHPVQIYNVDWSTSACSDPLLAAKSRRRILEKCCERNSLLLPAHFLTPSCGHVVDAGGGEFGFDWGQGDDD